MHAARDTTELLTTIWRQNDLLLHQQHFIITQMEKNMATFQEVADEMFATKTALGTVNNTLAGVTTAVGALRKIINDLKLAGGISAANAELLLAEAKTVTGAALATDAVAAGIDTNPDDDEVTS